MTSYKVFFVFVVIFGLSLSSVDASDLDIEIAKVKDKMDKRENKVLSLKRSLVNLSKLKVNTNVQPDVKTGGVIVALPCKKGFFSWGAKNRNVEYKDCSYKYSPTKKEDIDRLAESIKLHMLEGWVIDRSELFKQDIKNPDHIINIDRYRYKKL